MKERDHLPSLAKVSGSLRAAPHGIPLEHSGGEALAGDEGAACAKRRGPVARFFVSPFLGERPLSDPRLQVFTLVWL